MGQSIVDALTKSYPVRRDAVFLVGHSEGGTISLILGNNAPNTFRAVAAVEAGVPGNLTLYNWNVSSLGPPALLVWNAQDPVVDYTWNEQDGSTCTWYEHTIKLL